MSFTNYKAALKCPHCQSISSIQDDIEMYNKVSLEAGIFQVQEGDTIDIEFEDIDLDFIQINPPNSNNLRCIERWLCPTCKQYSFAEIIFILQEDSGLVAQIKSIDLTTAYLDEIHYLTERINDWAETYLNQRLFKSLKPTKEKIQILKDLLDKHPIIKR